MVKKEELIKKINKAFKDIKLEEGVGLWEAQGLDDRLNTIACKKLRAKDEKEEWNKIPLLHLYQCSSSVSFFDAKGMRFHFPIFLLFALGTFEKEQEELQRKGYLKGCAEPDIYYTIFSIIDYSLDTLEYQQFYTQRFSLFNNEQLKCITNYIEYKICELKAYYKSDDVKKYGLLPIAIKYDEEYIQLQKVLNCWIHNFKIK